MSRKLRALLVKISTRRRSKIPKSGWKSPKISMKTRRTGTTVSINKMFIKMSSSMHKSMSKCPIIKEAVLGTKRRFNKLSKRTKRQSRERMTTTSLMVMIQPSTSPKVSWRTLNISHKINDLIDCNLFVYCRNLNIDILKSILKKT